MDPERKIIVLAEDEALIRMLAADLLTDAGFDVLEAETAEQALAILHHHEGQAHLLFTDVHMPGELSGLELAHLVKRHWPRIGLLITSGHARPPVHTLPAEGIFISKPYQLATVIAHARALTGD